MNYKLNAQALIKILFSILSFYLLSYFDFLSLIAVLIVFYFEKVFTACLNGLSETDNNKKEQDNNQLASCVYCPFVDVIEKNKKRNATGWCKQMGSSVV